MGETQDAGQTGPEAVTDDVDVSAEIVHDADVSAEAADEDWEAQAAVVDPDGAADDPDDSDDPDDDEIDEASRVTTWISERAIAASGRFRQTAAELRQRLAGEASAEAAVDSLRAREGERTTDADVPKAPPVPRDLTAAAFFDVDNTLVHGASIVHFTRGLVAHNYFRYSDILDVVWAQAKFQITGKENADDVAEGREKALSFISGRRTSELIDLGEEIYDEYIADKIWPGTRALAQRHLDAGQQVWLVTATPVELA